MAKASTMCPQQSSDVARLTGATFKLVGKYFPFLLHSVYPMGKIQLNMWMHSDAASPTQQKSS